MSTVIVTSAQVAAAKLAIRRAYKRGEYPSAAVLAIAEAVLTSAPKKASNSVSIPYWYTAGELADRQKAHPRESITDSLDVMAALAKGKAGITSALAASQKKASNSVSKPLVLKCECPLDGGVRYTTHCGCSQCDYPNGAPIKPAKKVSENLSITHARELKIDDTVTVSDLFALIDRPYKVTRKAKVTFVARQDSERFSPTYTLRVEWTGDDE